MPKKLSPKELVSYKELLLHLRGVISGDINHLQQDAFGINGEKASVDVQADSGSDSYYQEFSLELLERDENTLREVDDALIRIKEGSFGLCEGCAAPIVKERLRAVPHARNCVECQRKTERDW